MANIDNREVSPANLCDIAEGLIEVSQEEQLQAWADLTTLGLVWQLQGFYGRTAVSLIDAGYIVKGEDGIYRPNLEEV